MGENTNILPDQPVAQLTASQLETLITTVVRRVVREELRDYYVNEHGIKVLYAAEEAAPAYLTALQEDYEAIQKGEVELVSGELDVANQRVIIDDIAQHDTAYGRINRL